MHVLMIIPFLLSAAQARPNSSDGGANMPVCHHYHLRRKAPPADSVEPSTSTAVIPVKRTKRTKSAFAGTAKSKYQSTLHPPNLRNKFVLQQKQYIYIHLMVFINDFGS